MAIETKTTALAPFEDMQSLLAPYKPEQFHRLVPTALQERSPLFRPALAVVKVNAEDTREVYPTPGGGDTYCLHTQTLEKIGNALGIDWKTTTFDRQAEQPFLVTAHVTAEYTDSVGIRRTINASATSDLRDGSITAEVLKGGLRTARQFIAERTEARARNRVVRKVTGMPTSFTKKELEKPFVAVRWRLDESDPDVKRAIIAQGVGASDQIFGRSPTAVEAIDAGHSEAIEELQGEFREQADEPEPAIPDEPQKIDVTAVAAAFQQRAKARPDHAQRASDELLGSLALAIATVYQLPNKSKDDKLAISTARKGIAFALFGAKVTELTSAQATVVIEATKSPAGQQDLLSIADVIGIPRTLEQAAAQL
jgi:hypothetical protein